MKIKIANGIAPDGMPRFAASHLGIFYLPMSNKKGRHAYMGKRSMGMCTLLLPQHAFNILFSREAVTRSFSHGD